MQSCKSFSTMPASGYSALPHSRRASISARAAEEMDMAFESDDEEQQNDTTPLANQYTPSRANVEDASSANSAMTYDFERDYDYPPPGSPPRTSMSELGNSNGIIPSFSTPPRRDPPSQPARPSFFRRAVGALLPQHYARVPTSDSSDTGHEARGSGVENDGVFSNVIAKSSNTAPRRPVGAGNDAGNDDVYVMPEEIQKEAPPVRSFLLIGYITSVLTLNSSHMMLQRQMLFLLTGRQPYTLLRMVLPMTP